MIRLRFLLSRVFQRARLDREMDEELQFHISTRAEALQKTGLSPAEALRTARLEFGGVEKFREEGRSMRRFQVFHDLGSDVRYGLRIMRKTPAFTAVAVITLALGIGANSAMFGIVYGLLYRPLPYPGEESIAAVHVNFSPQNNPRGNLSMADFVDWRNANTAFEQVAVYSRTRCTLSGEGQAEQVAAADVSADYFSVLGLGPAFGRVFRSGDDSPGAPSLVVISESLRQRRFGGEPTPVGRVIEVDNKSATIIGVVREGFGFPLQNIELWRNVHVKVTRRGPFFFQGLARLRAGVSLASAQAELNLIGHNIERANPGAYSNLRMPAEPLRNYLVGDLRPALFTMSGAVLAVLLIAVVNLANLLLARGSARDREIAVRLSLGAARRRLVQQLLTESVLLSLAGAVAGLVLAFLGLRLFRILDPLGVSLAYQVRPDWSVLLFTILVAVGAGILFGLVPAVQSSRRDLQTPLKEGGRSGEAAGHLRTRSALVVTEISLSLALLVSAALLLHSFLMLQRTSTGIGAPMENLLTMVVTPKAENPSRGQQGRQTIAFYQRVLENVGRLPGVQYVAISDSLPPDLEGEDDTFNIAGRPWSDQQFPSTTLPKVSPDYFRALDAPLLSGRFFNPDDTENSAPVTIISESLARRYFPGENPVGQKIQASAPGNNSPFMEIVGVVGDLKYWGLQNQAAPAYYQPYTQNSGGFSFLVVRSPRPAAALAPVIEREIRSLDKDVVVRRVLTMEDVMSQSIAEPRFRTSLLLGFGALGLVLSAVGIYGVIAYSVTQRTREIGVRMALGAQRADVLRMVMGQGARLTLIGLGLGTVASIFAARAVSRFLFSVRPGDPLAFLLGMALLALVALAATLIPALRATRINPLVALRYE